MPESRPIVLECKSRMFSVTKPVFQCLQTPSVIEKEEPYSLGHDKKSLKESFCCLSFPRDFLAKGIAAVSFPNNKVLPAYPYTIERLLHILGSEICAYQKKLEEGTPLD